MSTTVVTHPTAQETAGRVVRPREVRVYSHSGLLYWWPVWVVGFLFAILTWLEGVPATFGDTEVLIHPSKSIGVIFTAVFLLVIVLTHLSVRGVASMTVIVSLIALTIFFAYMGWWEDILRTLGRLAIYMNLGFYVFFSSAVFLVWAATVFVFDHLDYWSFHSGQLVHHTFFGSGEQTYDTRGMSVNKLRNDLFRHWILGLGTGDLHISATGARQAEFVVPNVLFVGTKLRHIEQLVAEKPDVNAGNIMTVGTPE
jgi:hypothetical protein